MQGTGVHSIGYRTIFDSHMGRTVEFIIELQDGACGIGSTSRGETIGIHEDHGLPVDPRVVVDSMRADGELADVATQAGFDKLIAKRAGHFGKNTCFALSAAYFDAWREAGLLKMPEGCKLPRLCMNVLNGGSHAYTNPVLSDFQEFIIVPKSDDLMKTVAEHGQVQELVKQRLLMCEKSVVNGNPVSIVGPRTAHAPLAFLAEVLEELGLRKDYDLMIDASATDLRTSEGYVFAITDGTQRTTEESVTYWLEVIEEYSLGFLEDPFHEEDLEGWVEITKRCNGRCITIGDNLYVSESARIERGAREGHSTAVLIKPNQAGSVSATRAAIEAAQAGGLLPITSHRSISTESTYVCDATCEYSVPYIKIGPLLSDYSSIMRLNHLLRLAGVGRG
ncbi:MAG: enolase C-terminal domain-like protein [Coriobacteriia bacterium]|jgi:enolase|nr:enolase C-terminal domain-like protein [Coriobacteriia bacterium]